MHPILAHLRRLALYLLAWIPIALLLAYLLGMAHTIRWQEAVAVAFPLCLVYAFVCLSAWYSCRVTPLERSSFSRLFLTHLTTALLATALWVIIAKVLVIELSQETLLPSPELLRQVCEGIEVRAVGAVYDPANMIVAREYPRPASPDREAVT